MEATATANLQQELRSRLYLLYHELRPNGSAYSYITDTVAFENHLDMYAAGQERCDSSLRPEITFDDGHVSNYEFALPRLQARGLKARFFITTGWTGRKPGYMDWSQLRALHLAGQLIGAHGWTHTLLTHCDAKQLDTELRVARMTLEDGLGAPVEELSLPGGRYNAKVLAACLDAGYTRIYTSVPKAEPSAPGSTIGRLNIRGDMDAEWIAKLLEPGSTVLSGAERQYRIKSAAQAMLGDRLYAKLWAILNGQENKAGEAETP